MGHIRLGTLPQSKKWRDVVGLIDSGASIDVIAEAAAKASERDLSKASKDPRFQFVAALLVRLPLLARAPGFEDALADLGFGDNPLASVANLLSGLDAAIERQSFGTGRVISPFLTGCIRRTYAAIFSFIAGVMPPMPMFGRS